VNSLIVAQDSKVYRMQRKNCVAQSNGKKVDSGHLCERLVVRPGISHHQKKLSEGCLYVASEGSRRQVASKRSRNSSTGICKVSMAAMV
jgi:hypothetical protein